MSALFQESTVQLGDQSIRVRTTALLEPELLLVNEIINPDGDVLKKTHAPMPAATVADYARRGGPALRAFIQTSHLRFVQRLLSTRSQPKPAGSPPARGMLATQVLGPDGRILRTVGEDQVPGSWLQVGFLLNGFARELGDAIGAGEVRWCVGMGDAVCVAITGGSPTKVCFLDPQRAAPREDLQRHLEAI